MEYNQSKIIEFLPKRPEYSNKGTFGHVLNIAGSGFYSGAAYFSSVASLKVGCGLVTLASAETVLRSVSALSPDVILMPIDETKEKTISSRAIKKLEKEIDKYSVISVGCGLSKNKETIKFFGKLMGILSKLQTPVVIDADGLNILSELKKVILPVNVILTPHPKEMSRLMGVNVDNILLQPEFWAKECCEKYNCTTVLKMHETVVANNKGKIYINKTGNSALAHGGSGDVLCGMISGFLAQGLSAFEASCSGVYLHGKTAEAASAELSEYSVLASDLINYIPKAIKSIL